MTFVSIVIGVIIHAFKAWKRSKLTPFFYVIWGCWISVDVMISLGHFGLIESFGRLLKIYYSWSSGICSQGSNPEKIHYQSSCFLCSWPHKLTSYIFWPCHLTLFWLVFLWNSLLQALHAVSLCGWKFKMAIQWFFFARLFFITWVTDYLFLYPLNIHVSWYYWWGGSLMFP